MNEVLTKDLTRVMKSPFLSINKTKIEISEGMDVAEIAEFLSVYSDHGIEEITIEIDGCAQEMQELNDEIDFKANILEALQQELTYLGYSATEAALGDETAKVEMIRAKTKQKQLKKSLEKLQKQTLNSSRIKVGIKESDKTRLLRTSSKVVFMKKLLGTFINSENKGFALNPLSGKIIPLQLDDNKSKKENQNSLWKSIGDCSNPNNEWKALFE